jgi:biopolymer transport protein ExbD
LPPPASNRYETPQTQRILRDPPRFPDRPDDRRGLRDHALLHGPRRQGQDGEPPQHQTAIATPDEIAIRIEDDGQIYLNDDPLDTPEAKNLPELAGNLIQLQASAIASKSEVLVTIYANEQAKYERIIDCLDALTRANISNVSFQAASPE